MSDLLPDLIRYLKLTELAARMMERPATVRYRCYEELVLHEGRAWAATSLPPFIEPGPMKHCYFNTLAVVRYSQQHLPEARLRYCEGYAVTPLTGVPVQHAWAVTPDGRVIDRTWPDNETCAYYGMTFELHDVERLLELTREYYGVLSSEYIIGCPLLTTGRLTLPERPTEYAPTKATLLRLGIESREQARLFERTLASVERGDMRAARAALGFAFSSWVEMAQTLTEGRFRDEDGEWASQETLDAKLEEAFDG